MTRSIPASAQQDIERQSAEHAYLAFLTIDHSSLSEPIRIVSDVIDYVVGGDSYIAAPFGFRLLTDNESQPSGELVMQNVDRRIGETLRTLTGQAEATLTIYSDSDFDLSVEPRVEIGTASKIYTMQYYQIRSVTVSVDQVTASVSLTDYTQEPWPRLSAVQVAFPGLYF